MKISVEKSGDGNFTLSFGDTRISLSEADLAALSAEINGLHPPGARSTDNGADLAGALLGRLKHAEDVGIQSFILASNEEDILVLLKAAEDDAGLLAKFYDNMSERSRKLHVEDLAYKFKAGIPDHARTAAFARLLRTARRMEEEGTLVFRP